jgi:N-acetylglucosamine kinase-like BadF-type ATPase
MVDLRATNEKLRLRTNRIVRLLTGLDAAAAEALLERCGRELKTALVAQLAGVGPGEARARLEAAAGQVRRALGPLAGSPRGPVSPAADDLVLGIDGGGTGTVALLAEARPGADAPWVPLGRGEAGPSNIQAVGTAEALRALEDAIGRAFAAPGLERRPVASACFGLAGAGRPEDQAVVRSWAEQAGLARVIEVTSDTALLLAVGTPDGWGVAVVAGTGSTALARTAGGATARAGGWGCLMGDEGSGYALTLAGLRAVARADDGRGPATRLTEAFLRELGLAKPADLVATVYRGGRDRAGLAALAPVVLRCAQERDAVAETVVTAAADELAEAAVAAARKSGLEHQTVPLALAGGVLLASSNYRERVLEAVAAKGLRVGPVTLVSEPAEGAVRLALAGHAGSRS